MNITHLIATSLLITSCSLFENKRTTALETTLSTYRTAIRWGYWNQLLSFYNSNSAKTITFSEKIKITAYEVLQPPIFINEKYAIQVVEIQYILNDKQVLHKILDKQNWHYNEATKLWQLHNSLPKFY